MTVNKDTLFEQCDMACDYNANMVNSCNAGNDAEAMSDSFTSSVDAEFVVPVYVNKRRTFALCDTGCNGKIIVDYSLISPEIIKTDEHETYLAAFDGDMERNLPVTEITISSPHFGTKEEFRVKAAVANLPKGLKCILGNLLYKDNDINDLIQIRPNKTARCPESRSEAKFELSVGADANPSEVTGHDKTPTIVQPGKVINNLHGVTETEMSVELHDGIEQQTDRDNGNGLDDAYSDYDVPYDIIRTGQKTGHTADQVELRQQHKPDN